MLNIGIDIDGPIYPWHYSIYRYFTEFKGFEGDIFDFWTNHKEKITDYYVDLPMLYNDTSPTVDVQTYLPKIAELGTIYYITSRPQHVKPTTRKFFEFWDLPFKENIIFSGDKANYIRLNKIEYFLDDLTKNIDAIKNVCNAYLFKNVHNYYQREGYNVINNMKEYYELLSGVE